ncbi:unnamed protein product [Brassica oleracea]
MKRWGLDPKEKTIFLMVDVEENVVKSSRNIGMLRKYGVEALVTGDEDENVRKFTT